jgi:hypothetical protein
MILGRLARVAPVRAGGNAHCECLLRVEGQNAQRRNEEMNEWEEMRGSGAAPQERREGAVRCGAVRVYGSTEWRLREWEPNWQIGNVVLMLMFERVKLPSRDLAAGLITATKKGRPSPNILMIEIEIEISRCPPALSRAVFLLRITVRAVQDSILAMFIFPIGNVPLGDVPVGIYHTQACMGID